MADSIEIRHTQKEKFRQLFAALLLLLANDFVRLKFGYMAAERLPYYLLVDLSLMLLTWLVLSRQFVRMDSTGVTCRKWFGKREVKWEQIASYSANWQMGFDDFLFSSYGWHNLQGKIVLKDKNSDKLVNVKIDFGSTKQRNEVKAFIMSRLQSLAT